MRGYRTISTAVRVVSAVSMLALPSIAMADTRVIDEPGIRVSDLVDLSTLEGEADPHVLQRIADTEIFRLSRNEVTTLSSQDILDAIARRVPGLKDHLVTIPDADVTFVYRASSESSKTACVELVSDIGEGEPIRRDDVAETSDCADVAPRYALRRVAGHAAAACDLKDGTRLPIASARLLPALVGGDSLTLVSKVGPVSITRPVELARAVTKPGPVWVRTSDGNIISVTLDTGYFDDAETFREVQP